jgi:peptide/nickel transport system substrate-binding protein
LRQGVKFHDGSDFNAEAVKWNMDLQIEAGKARDWKSVDVLGEYTVRINIDGYKNTILSGLAAGAAQIVSPTAVEENGLEWARWHPIGTGPFKFVEYERDARLVYERNDDYWNEGLPYLDGLEFVVIADETVRSIAFQRGDIHALRASGLVAQELQGMGFDYVTRSGGTFILIPDSKNAESPFADLKVRQAFSHAIDRESLADALGYGFSRPAYQVYPGFPETAIPNLDKHEFDQDLARQLLADAGYQDGFQTTIHAFTRVVPRDYITAIANMLGEVGIEVTPDFPEAGKYSEYRFDGWSDAMMAHAMASSENMNWGFTFYFGGIQFPSVQKPAGWQEAYDAALSSENIDPVKTQALVKLMHDELMVIPYLEETAVAFIREGVNDDTHLKDSLTTVTEWEITWLDPELR